MISQREIEKLSTRAQVGAPTIATEYLQNYFLSEFYKQKNSGKLLFKGGTALRLIYQSPRYSEDLDFIGINNITYPEIENILTNTLSNLSAWGFGVELLEAKKTTGGYLSNISFAFAGYKIILSIQISFRIRKQKSRGVVGRIKNNFIPHYDIYQLSQKEIVEGKIKALLTRSKPRDWYDLYFFLHNQMLPKEQMKKLPEVFGKLKRTTMDFRKELKLFLPRSHQMILKDFKGFLKKEIEKYL